MYNYFGQNSNVDLWYLNTCLYKPCILAVLTRKSGQIGIDELRIKP